MNKGNAELHPKKVMLLPSEFKRRAKINRDYVISLKSENLLQNHYIEAGLKSWSHKPEGIHWGWESPECQLRGHFLGHWLSAAARIYHETGDTEVKGKADYIVSELGRCQKENGGEWVGSIPEKYLEWIAQGKRVWAPHYTLHKTFMGLVDMYKFAGNEEALAIADKWANWFHRWTAKFTREQMDDILDVETGGMLEVWADLYGITRNNKYLDLIERYDRPRLFERLLAGEDPLTNKHANTTIPEIHGAARVWEVTGNDRYRKIVEAYWKQAVDERGYFCTGGQTCAEAWTPKQILGARLGPTNQEHCVVYNMIRLAEYLYRWTGDVKYADYIERNLYNGIMAQQNPRTGMVTYYLSLHPNSVKQWGTPTDDFWCCHGTLVQAHTLYADLAFYESKEGIVLSQYIPSKLKWQYKDVPIEINQDFIGFWNSSTYPLSRIKVEVKAESPSEFTLIFRIPWWVTTTPTIEINGDKYDLKQIEIPGYAKIKRVWKNDKVIITFSTNVTLSPLPDMPNMAAFMYGPIVLAGLSAEKTLYANGKAPHEMLRPINENRWDNISFYTVDQIENFKFIPLYNVIDERYTIYFPIK